MKLRLKYTALLLISTVGLLALFQNCGKGFSSSTESSVLSSMSNSGTDSSPLSIENILVTSDKAVVSQHSDQIFNFFSEAGANSRAVAFKCSLNKGTSIDCRSPFGFSSVSEGSNSLVIEGLDSENKVVARGEYVFKVDKTAPNLVFNSFPGSITGSEVADFTFSGIDSVSGVKEVRCGLDTNVLSVQSSPYHSAALPDGDHYLVCQAVDNAGNLSSLMRKSWRTSRGNPIVSLNAGLKQFSGSSNTILFTASTTTGENLTTTCSLDGAAFSICSGTGTTFNSLTEGSHSVTVKATDALARQSTVEYVWKVDLTAPTVSFIQPSSLFTSATVFQASFASSDLNGSGVKDCQCRVGSGAAVTCTSPFNFSLGSADSIYDLKVQCTDQVGNTSSLATLNIRLDHTPPTVNYTTSVSSLSMQKSAVFAISGQDSSGAGVTLWYKLDSQEFMKTDSVVSINNLVEGTHTITFKAVDQAGNDSMLKAFVWTVDTLPPTNPTSVIYSKTAMYFQPTVEWGSSSDGSGVDAYQIKIGTTKGGEDLLPVQEVSGVLTSYSVPSTYNTFDNALGGYKFQYSISYIAIRARDKLGQYSDWVTSGPTNNSLYDEIYGYDLACQSVGCLRASKVNTNYSILNMSAPPSLEPYLIVDSSASFKVLSNVQNSALSKVATFNPGAFTATCKIDNYIFSCDVANGFSLDSYVTSFPKLLTVDIYFNGELFFQIKKQIMKTDVFNQKYSSQILTGLNYLVKTPVVDSSTTDTVIKQLWVDSGAKFYTGYVCWKDAAKGPATLVAGDNSAMKVNNTINPFGDCLTKVYAGNSSYVYIGGGNVDQLSFSQNSHVFLKTGWGGVKVKIYSFLPSGINSVSNCPYSSTGSCPSDLQVLSPL